MERDRQAARLLYLIAVSSALLSLLSAALMEAHVLYLAAYIVSSAAGIGAIIASVLTVTLPAWRRLQARRTRSR